MKKPKSKTMSLIGVGNRLSDCLISKLDKMYDKFLFKNVVVAAQV